MKEREKSGMCVCGSRMEEEGGKMDRCRCSRKADVAVRVPKTWEVGVGVGRIKRGGRGCVWGKAETETTQQQNNIYLRYNTC